MRRRTSRTASAPFGFVGTATYDVLPRVSRRLRAELPDIDLELHGEQLSPTLLEMVTERRVDLAVVRNPQPGNGFDTMHLRTEPLIAALPADFAGPGQHAVALKDLRERTFVTHPSGHRSAMFSAAMDACRHAGFTAEIRLSWATTDDRTQPSASQQVELSVRAYSRVFRNR